MELMLSLEEVHGKGTMPERGQSQPPDPEVQAMVCLLPALCNFYSFSKVLRSMHVLFSHSKRNIRELLCHKNMSFLASITLNLSHHMLARI